MENKLEELTRRLYDEGLSKGRSEAETLLSNARSQAERIVADALREAEKIKRDAEKASEDLRSNTLTELNLAGRQAVDRIKGAVREMIVTKALGDSVSNANLDPQFLKEILTVAAKSWQESSREKTVLKAMLPEKVREKFDRSIEESIKSALGEGGEIVFSGSVESGFRIAPANGGFYIDFSDEGFEALLCEYLRPKVGEMLYGKNE